MKWTREVQLYFYEEGNISLHLSAMSMILSEGKLSSDDIKCVSSVLFSIAKRALVLEAERDLLFKKFFVPGAYDLGGEA